MVSHIVGKWHSALYPEEAKQYQENRDQSRKRKIPFKKSAKPPKRKKILRDSSIQFRVISAEEETVNLFRLMITGAVQGMSPRNTLAMINAAGMGDAKIGDKLRSEGTIREVWKVVSLIIRRNLFSY